MEALVLGRVGLVGLVGQVGQVGQVGWDGQKTARFASVDFDVNAKRGCGATSPEMSAAT